MTEDLEKHRAYVAARLRQRAMKWTFDGRMPGGSPQGMAALLSRHRAYVDDVKTGCRLIFTRDVGHHTSGWMKNPDYERCLHLSISPIHRAARTELEERLLRGMAEHTLQNEAAWVAAFFPGDEQRCLWFESAKSPEGRAHEVKHWRLFCDPTWHALLPRGEVYSTDFTEKGWKSWSEQGNVIISTVDPT